MNTERTTSLLVALLLLGAALPLLVLDASGTRWEQTSADDFDDGESFFVNTDAGTLKLAYDLVEGWSIAGEGTSDYFGISVASAGDVNGDGYDDVIVGAYYDASYTGKTYVWHGSSTGLTDGDDASDADWSIAGEGTSDNFGYSVASAGDVNGDGYDDVIVGAYGVASNTGKTYVWLGSSTGLTDGGDDAGDADWSIAGEGASDYFGISVASAGDVNGDGYDDVIISAYYDASSTGKAYVWHGSSTGLTDGGDDAGDADWSIAGEGTNDWFGSSVASAGDVNGDGYDDVIVGASRDASYTGKAYVWHGSSTGLTDGSDAGDADWSIAGEGTSSFGVSVASAGDVNGDGYDDVIVGAYYNASSTGKTYVWHGSSTGLTDGDDAGDADWSIAGEGTNDYFGIRVASAGDVNGDGYDDVIVGAHYDASQTGKAYVWHGSSTGLTDGDDAGDADWSIAGEGASDNFGWSVASAGDVNGDGYDDVIVGAYGDASSRGKAYVWHGSATGLTDGDDAGDADWSIAGEGTSGRFGASVASAGDVNGDGYDDVIIGAYYDASGTGKTYVWHGHGYIQKGMFDSSVLDVDCTCGVDWQSLSWNPVVQPDGTSVKAQIGTSDDGVTWSWRGPDGSSTSYYTQATGQAIYSGDRGKLLRVHFIMESEYGTGGAVVGNLVRTHTPTVTDFTVSYLKFTIPSISLTWPNGGENLMHSEKYAVTWTASGDMKNSTPVNLEYSLNGGSSWSNIATGIANDGHHLWTVPPNENVERALIRITATALDGSTVQDTSDGTFSIDPPEFWQTGDDGETTDTEPPVITLFPPGKATAGEPLTIRAEVSDETAVTQVALRYTAADGEPVTVAMSPAGNGVWEVVLLPAEGNLALTVIASDGTNVVETQATTLEVAAGAAPAAPASSGSLLAAAALGAVAMLGALALRRRPD